MNNNTKKPDSSAKLAEKMLLGWTLLGIHCPKVDCSIPLVRNRQGQIYCVNCEQWAVEEKDVEDNAVTATEEVKEQGGEPDVPAEPKQSPPPPLSPQAAAASENSHPEIISMTVETLYSQLDRVQQELQTANVPRSLELLKLARELAHTIVAFKYLTSA